MIIVFAVLAALGVGAAGSLYLLTARAKRTRLDLEARLATLDTSALRNEALSTIERLGLSHLDAAQQLARGEGELLPLLEQLVVDASPDQPTRSASQGTVLHRLFASGYMSIVEEARRRTAGN